MIIPYNVFRNIFSGKVSVGVGMDGSNSDTNVTYEYQK